MIDTKLHILKLNLLGCDVSLLVIRPDKGKAEVKDVGSQLLERYDPS